MRTFHLLALAAFFVILTSCVSNQVSTQTPDATLAATAMTDTTGWPDTFIYGIFDKGDAGTALTNAEPLRAYLEKKLQVFKPSIRVTVYTGTAYTAVIEAVKAGRIDAFEVGPFPYILAAQETSVEPLGVHTPDASDAKVFDRNAVDFYHGTIFTMKGNGANIRTVEDLKGKSFAFVDPASTSGHLISAALIKAAGIDPDTDMKAIYAGSASSVILSVEDGKVDAGATTIGNLFIQMKAGKIDLCYFADNDIIKVRTPEEFAALYDSCKDGQIVPIVFSEPIPGTPFVVNHGLPDTFRTVLRDIITTGMQNDPAWISANGYWYADPSIDMHLKNLDAYYDSLRNVAKILGLDLKSIVK